MFFIIKLLDFFIDSVFIFEVFFTAITPLAFPLTLTPRVSENNQSLFFIFLHVLASFNFPNIHKTVCMVEHETSGMTIKNQFTTFSIAFNTAAHETSILESVQKIGPKTISWILVSMTVVINHHLVWENTRLLISDQDLLRLKSS